jgi:hypothetical protein
MNAPQIIRTPAGEELVVLPRAEYEVLLDRADYDEDADDIAIYDARKAELDAGEAVLSAEVSAFVLKGDNLLRAVRKWRGKTERQLATETGIDERLIRDLENRIGKPTPEASAKLAQALDVPAEWLS